MDNAAGPQQLQEEVNGAEERQWLQVSLTWTQSLSVRFAQDIDTRVVSGSYWISTDGVYLAIGPGERVKLPAGLALIDGEGVLQLAPADGPGACVPYPFSWWLDQLFKRRAMALEININ